MAVRVAAGAAARSLIVALALAAAPAAVACGGSGPPPPSTGPSTGTASSPPTLTSQQIRCMAEARFLIRTADAIVHVLPVQDATPGTGGMPAAVDALRAQLDALRARPIHVPFVLSQRELVQAATTMITGYEGLLGPGHHEQDRQDQAKVTAGASMATATAANLVNIRARCEP